jgi:hypothetical protein
MKWNTTLATFIALGISTAMSAQQPAAAQSAPNPSTSAESQPHTGDPPTQPHTGRGTEDDVQPSPPPGQPPGEGGAQRISFETADKDHDGKVNRSEASSFPGLDFARADSDRDSSLSRQEFLAAVRERPRG